MDASARPVDAVRAGAFWHVLTDDGSWILFDEHGQRVRASEEPGTAARLIALGQAAFLFRFDATVVRSVEGDLEHWALPAPVLAAAVVESSLVIGAVTGAIEVRDENCAVVASANATEPIAEIAAVPGRGFVALGLYGSLWRARWPADVLELEPLRAGLRERVVGLFPTAMLDAVGVSTMTTVGWLDVGTGSVRPAAMGMEQGARCVVELGHGARLAVLGDEGELAIVAPGTARTSRLQEVIGVSVAGDEGLLAWTGSGTLFQLSPDSSSRKLVDDGVALARYAGGRATVVFRSRGSGPIAMDRVTEGTRR
jgi:hypothetical protein